MVYLQCLYVSKMISQRCIIEIDTLRYNNSNNNNTQSWKLLTIFAKRPILDDCLGPECVYVVMLPIIKSFGESLIFFPNVSFKKIKKKNQ